MDVEYWACLCEGRRTRFGPARARNQFHVVMTRSSWITTTKSLRGVSRLYCSSLSSTTHFLHVNAQRAEPAATWIRLLIVWSLACLKELPLQKSSPP